MRNILYTAIALFALVSCSKSASELNPDEMASRAAKLRGRAEGAGYVGVVDESAPAPAVLVSIDRVVEQQLTGLLAAQKLGSVLQPL